MRKLEDKNMVERRVLFDELCGAQLPSIVSEKLLEFFFSLINSRDNKIYEVVFSAREFCKQIGWESKASESTLKDYIDEFSDIQITGEDLANGIVYEKSPLFTRSCLRWIDEELCFDLKVNEDAFPLMFNYKDRYVSYHVGNIKHLSSVYSLRLHRLLQREVFRGKFEISVEALKSYLGLENAYLGKKGWSEFKRRVLEDCVKELNEKTELDVSWSKGRLGKAGKVLTVVFTIAKNEERAKKIFSGSWTPGYENEQKKPEITGDRAKEIAGEAEPVQNDNSQTDTESEAGTEDSLSVITEPELKTMADFSDYGQFLKYFESLPEALQNEIIAKEMKENEIMMILQIVDFSFTKNEATVIYDILHKLVRDGKDQESKEFAELERRALMKQAYKKLRAYEAQNQDKGTPIKNRFNYFLSILDNWDDDEY